MKPLISIVTALYVCAASTGCISRSYEIKKPGTRTTAPTALTLNTEEQKYKELQQDWVDYLSVHAQPAFKALGDAKGFRQSDKNNMFFVSNASNLTAGVLVTASSANAVTAAGFIAFSTLISTQSKAQEEGEGGLDMLQQQTGELYASYAAAEDALVKVGASTGNSSAFNTAVSNFNTAKNRFEIEVGRAMGTPTPDGKGIIRRTWANWW